MLFKIENLNLKFGEKIIFDKINLVFNQGDKIGIIGDNGVGKTTLFNLILNKIEYSENLFLENDNFGFLSQDDSFEELKLISSRKEKIEKLMLKEEIVNDLERYTQLLEEYNNIVLENNLSYEEELVKGFNFNKELFEKEEKENLSGGETTKLKLIKLFTRNYDYYLLDEPTNHLDIEAKMYLIEKLDKINSFMLISHDVDLLNKTCNKILEITNAQIKIYNGNYDNYLEEKEKEKEEVLKIQTEHKKEKKRIETNILNIKSNSSKKIKEKTKDFAKGQVLNNMGNGRGGMQNAIRETSKKVNKLKDKINNLETPDIENEENIKIKYLNFTKPNTQVLKINDLRKSFGDFKLKIDKFELFNDDKVAFQGNNGCGKSTLLKLIIGEIKHDFGKIEIGNRIKLGYLSQKNETLNFDNNVLKEILDLNINLDEGEIRKYLGKFLFKKNDVFKTIKDLSGGEKIRLALLKLILKGCNFLVLDEPSNHLDIKSKEVLAQSLKDFPGAILVVSHDNYFLDKFVTNKIKMEMGKIL